MNIDDEKKLALKELFGIEVAETGYYQKVGKPKKGYIKPLLHIRDWNPQDNETGRKWWPKIWEKMSYDMFIIYLGHLRTGLKINHLSNLNLIEISVHTAKPEICWKALIKTLEE